MKSKNYSYRLLEIVVFYIISSISLFIIGYVTYDLLVKSGIITINIAEDALHEVENVDGFLIFKNNILFFALISVLPIFNWFMVLAQFFQLGFFAFSISELSLRLQFLLLYRHTFFEILALFAAVYISQLGLTIGKKFVNNVDVEEGYYKKSFIKIAWTYLFILIATVIGALLEGNVNV